MPGLPGGRRLPLNRPAVGRKPERDRARKVGDRGLRSPGVEAEATHHERDARRPGL